VIEAMRKANVGKKHTDAAWQHMSHAQRKHGAYPPEAGVPWITAENAFLGKMPATELARRTGRTLNAARDRRYAAAGRVNLPADDGEDAT
jgi:hypothetical protein